MIGQKLRERREANDLVQRQFVAVLEVATACVSETESNEKPMSQRQLKKLSMLFNVSEVELNTFRRANKGYDVFKDEEVASEAMHTADNLALNFINRKVRGR